MITHSPNEEIEWQTRRVAATAIEAQERKELFLRGSCRFMYWKKAELARERAVASLRQLQGLK